MRVSRGWAVSACMVGLSGVRMVMCLRCSHRWKVSSTLGGTTRIANAVPKETRYQSESPRKWRSPAEVMASWSPGRWVSTSVAVAAIIWSRVAAPCWPKGGSRESPCLFVPGLAWDQQDVAHGILMAHEDPEGGL